MTLRHRFFAYTSVVLATLAACKGESAPTGDRSAPPTPSSSATTATGGPFTPDPGGKVVAVELYSDANGNYFKPAEVHVNRGDVVRFTLKVGVHNVHFLADSNAGRTGYPAAASDFLQLPGQTWDVAVKMPAGTYYFQCDPHAALGMKGRLIVH
jgi:plastocyanin